MRMKEKGISTALLVAIPVIIVVAVVVPVVAIVVLRGGGGALADVPVYPGAQATENDVKQQLAAGGVTLSAGWDGKLYTTQGSPGDVASWYRSNMPGWTKTGDNTFVSGAITYYCLGYRKGNDGAIIMAATSEGVNYLVILAGPATPASGGSTDGATGGSIVGTWSGTHLGSTETFTFNSTGTYSWSSGSDQANGT